MLGDVAEPAEQPSHPVEVVPLRLVGDAVVVHDLDAAELRVRGVDLPAQELVQRAGTRQDDGRVLNLEVWEPLLCNLSPILELSHELNSVQLKIYAVILTCL